MGDCKRIILMCRRCSGFSRTRSGRLFRKLFLDLGDNIVYIAVFHFIGFELLFHLLLLDRSVCYLYMDLRLVLYMYGNFSGVRFSGIGNKVIDYC